MTEPETTYERRIEAVIQYICAHLDEALSVERLSEVAGFSKFHFHRQFSAYVGVAVAEFVRRTRLKRAAYQLAFDPRRRIIEIALDAGFAAPESFTRAFKAASGQTPSEFRRAPRWELIHAARPSTPNQRDTMTPEIVRFEETRVAVLEHRGPAESLMASVGRFIEWRRSCKDSPVAECRTFGIPRGKPRDEPAPEAFRFDICGELKGPLSPNDAGVVEKIIPGGRCAVVRHVGSTDALRDTVQALYGSWLPGSGETLRDFPCYFHYVARMPAVAEHEQVTDVYLPLV